MKITYKQQLRENASYNNLQCEQYLELLKRNESSIYQGIFEIYLTRKVLVDGQEMYQSYIDIDGVSGLEREDIAADVAVIVRKCKELTFSEIFPEVSFVVNPEIRESWG